MAVLREVTPDIPCTTNLMASSATKSMDYFGWAKDLDVIANDHYLVAADPERHVELAFSADLTRGIAGGDPWILMEHSTSAVNWQPRNQPKMPGEMLRNSLAHVARGADAVMFFQWRQSFAGSEKFHSAMVPHGGRDTRVWREVVELGGALKRLEPVRGSRVQSRAAIVFDYEAWWASRNRLQAQHRCEVPGPAAGVPQVSGTARGLRGYGASVSFAGRLRPGAGVHAVRRVR